MKAEAFLCLGSEHLNPGLEPCRMPEMYVHASLQRMGLPSSRSTLQIQ